MHADLTPNRLSSVTRPTHDVRDAIDFFASASDSTVRSLWLRPATGEALVGLGAAATLIGSGPDRFQQISAGWQELSASASIEGAQPVLIGGFSFDPLRATSSLWDGFPEAQMVLPERMLAIRPGGAHLTTNVVGGDARSVRPFRQRAERGLSGDAWQELVRDIEGEIRRDLHGLRKVVLATAREVLPTVSVESALRRLSEAYPTCTIFAFAYGNACFLGATPERLIALRHGTATTTALAGSAPRGGTPDQDAALERSLLTDRKEREEHAIVVTALRGGLSQVCERVVVDAAPRVRKLENVQHLTTTLHGQLQRGRTVLDLVAQLHPTPALGGWPRARALQLIRERERLDRGWYAAPIGWMDGTGDGEFMAGIRSGLVRDQVATLFAGCGIVAGSDPRREYAELGWKLRPMLSALGVAP